MFPSFCPAVLGHSNARLVAPKLVNVLFLGTAKFFAGFAKGAILKLGGATETVCGALPVLIVNDLKHGDSKGAVAPVDWVRNRRIRHQFAAIEVARRLSQKGPFSRQP